MKVGKRVWFYWNGSLREGTLTGFGKGPHAEVKFNVKVGGRVATQSLTLIKEAVYSKAPVLA